MVWKKLIKKRILGKGHQTTRVLQPQRGRGTRERENERGVEGKRGKMWCEQQKCTGGSVPWCCERHVLSDLTAVTPTHIAEKTRHHHSVDVKKRDVFIQRRFYTETLLHTDAFTHRYFYTQTLSHRDTFTRTTFFTHRRFYTRTLLHTYPFTQILFYTQTFLHIKVFTHIFFYTQRPFCSQTPLHAEVFTPRRFSTQKLLLTGSCTHRRFYRQNPLHTGVFTRRRFYNTHQHEMMLWNRNEKSWLKNANLSAQHSAEHIPEIWFTSRPKTSIKNPRRYPTGARATSEISDCTIIHTVVHVYLLHTGAFTHTNFYLQTPFTHRCFYRCFYTPKFLHTDSFTHRHFYPQTLYTQTLLHTDVFTYRPF